MTGQCEQFMESGSGRVQCDRDAVAQAVPNAGRPWLLCAVHATEHRMFEYPISRRKVRVLMLPPRPEGE